MAGNGAGTSRIEWITKLNYSLHDFVNFKVKQNISHPFSGKMPGTELNFGNHTPKTQQLSTCPWCYSNSKKMATISSIPKNIL